MAMVAAIHGCATLDQLAPPVGPPILELAASRGVESASVVRGREIYVTNCVRCHSPEPVDRYTADHWKEILPRMSDRAGLEPQDAEAVEAYVLLTLETAGSRDANGPQAGLRGPGPTAGLHRR